MEELKGLTTEEIEEKTNDKTHGSNGGLSDGSDSWKYGG